MKKITLFIFIICSISLIKAQTTEGVSKDCEAASVGNVKLTNNGKYDLWGKICLRKVDMVSGNIHGTFCEEFTILKGQSVYFGDVLKGNAECIFRFKIPDPDNFKQTTLADEQNKNVYIQQCKVTEVSFP